MTFLDKCLLCDTLRNDDDTGDECVDCGAVYLDPPKRVKWVAPPPVASGRVSCLGPQKSAPRHPHRMRGWYHNVNLTSAATSRGLDKGRRGR